jgi:hypothetical protein
LRIIPKLGAHPFDPNDAFTVVDEVFTVDVPRLGLREVDVSCNYTGGPKPIVIGMALSCAGRRCLAYSQEGEEEVLLELYPTSRVKESTPIKLEDDATAEGETRVQHLA